MTIRNRRAPAHQKALISACVESGAGIEYLPDAPRFRYFPPADRPLHNGRPSPRGSIACGRGNVLKLRSWHPVKLDASPMYGVPMTDTDADEYHAKADWRDGNPEPLRQLLAERAAAKRAPVQFELERIAA
jgi:hypothetical protein